jgi:hypothetical protein
VAIKFFKNKLFFVLKNKKKIRDFEKFDFNLQYNCNNLTLELVPDINDTFNQLKVLFTFIQSTKSNVVTFKIGHIIIITGHIIINIGRVIIKTGHMISIINIFRIRIIVTI